MAAAQDHLLGVVGSIYKKELIRIRNSILPEQKQPSA